MLSTFLDTLGIESGRAQELSGPITSVENLKSNRDQNQTILLYCDKNIRLGGFLKFGYKHLFFYVRLN